MAMMLTTVVHNLEACDRCSAGMIMLISMEAHQNKNTVHIIGTIMIHAVIIEFTCNKTVEMQVTNGEENQQSYCSG